jgi:hypothetical protein
VHHHQRFRPVARDVVVDVDTVKAGGGHGSPPWCLCRRRRW